MPKAAPITCLNAGEPAAANGAPILKIKVIPNPKVNAGQCREDEVASGPVLEIVRLGFGLLCDPGNIGAMHQAATLLRDT
jgi:hypothetical protein